MSPSRGEATNGDPAHADGVSDEVLVARVALKSFLSGLHVLDVLPERSRMLAVDAQLPVHSVLSTVISEQHPRPPHEWRRMRRRNGSGDNTRGQDRWTDPRTSGPGRAGVTIGEDAAGLTMMSRDNRGMRREAASLVSTWAGEEYSLPTLSLGVPPPALPSNVLVEVCEFNSSSAAASTAAAHSPVDGTASGHAADSGGAGAAAIEREPSMRRWTSPEDGWGREQSLPMQDLAQMPMGMPVTIGELSDFLLLASLGTCSSSDSGVSAQGGAADEDGKADGPARWAEPRKQDGAAAAGGGEEACTQGGRNNIGDNAEPGGDDMMDWSLAQWRTQRLFGGQAAGPSALASSESRAGEDDAASEAASRLHVEERARVQGLGPVLVHRVPSAPPRPILCTDDPEASLLKAVQLLLAYPELDALPVVSHIRCTVVAHLTLSYCLTYLVNRLRGPELMPLGDLLMDAEGGTGPVQRRVFKASEVASFSSTGDLMPWACPATPSGSGGGRSNSDSLWAWQRNRPDGGTPASSTTTVPAVGPQWVLTKQQPLQDLLVFFAQTHYSSVPIVEDEASCGVLGVLSRRDLLQFLDLTLQSANIRRVEEKLQQDTEAPTDGDRVLSEDANIVFDVSAPVEAVLATLRRVRSKPSEEPAQLLSAGMLPSMQAAPNETPAAGANVGAVLVYEKELSLKALLLRILGCQNRKLLFVKEQEGKPDTPTLRRLVSVSDIWLLLVGNDLGAELDVIDSDVTQGGQATGSTGIAVDGATASTDS
eukprot:TRINITY_DN12111_c0_g1_i1.p1 TRINITY_DN12111_c0_g1~~TRINITY_DN12111_c0_g1_i1.p1  ORF type:complete len:765 (-),score=144.55 TRINITY_DN12111_c0_g1_i1:136-2430(-)